MKNSPCLVTVVALSTVMLLPQVLTMVHENMNDADPWLRRVTIVPPAVGPLDGCIVILP